MTPVTVRRFLGAAAMLLALSTAAAAQTAHSVTLNWVAPSDASSANPVAYNVLRAAGACASGQTFAALAAGTGLAATTFVDATVIGGQDYCYEVEAEGANGAISVKNPTVTATVPPFPPSSLTAAPQ